MVKDTEEAESPASRAAASLAACSLICAEPVFGVDVVEGGVLEVEEEDDVEELEEEPPDVVVDGLEEVGGVVAV